MKVVVSEERRVHELGGRRPPRLLEVEAALHEVHALRRPVGKGALHALVLLLVVVALCRVRESSFEEFQLEFGHVLANLYRYQMQILINMAKKSHIRIR